MSEQGGLQAAREGVTREWRIMLDEAMSADSWPTRQQFDQAAAALDVLEWTAKVEALESGDNLLHLIVYLGPSETKAAHELIHEHIAAAKAELTAARQRREAR